MKKRHRSKGAGLPPPKKMLKPGEDNYAESRSWWLKEIEAVDTLTLHFKATHRTSRK